MQEITSQCKKLPPVVIVAGGKGVRMGDLTQHIPKALVKVGNNAFLFHQIKTFAKQGFKEFFIASGYQHSAMLNYLQQQDEWSDFSYIKSEANIHFFNVSDISVKLIDTATNNGNAGRIKLLEPLLPERFIMTWCDNISDVSLKDMLAFHEQHETTMTMLTVNPPERFGLVTLENETVIKLDEKLPDPDRWINAGLFIVDKSVFNFISSTQAMWEFDVLPKLINKYQLNAFKYDGYWQCMDNINDRMILEKDCINKIGPWQKLHPDEYSSHRL